MNTFIYGFMDELEKRGAKLPMFGKSPGRTRIGPRVRRRLKRTFTGVGRVDRAVNKAMRNSFRQADAADNAWMASGKRSAKLEGVANISKSRYRKLTRVFDKIDSREMKAHLGALGLVTLGAVPYATYRLAKRKKKK